MCVLENSFNQIKYVQKKNFLIPVKFCLSEHTLNYKICLHNTKYNQIQKK